MSREAIGLEAAELLTGETRYVDCPFCTRTRKLGITRNADGVLFNCFSTRCSERGFIPDVYTYNRKRDALPKKQRRYIGTAATPSTEDYEYFKERFGVLIWHVGMAHIPTEATFGEYWEIGVTAHGEYLFPIVDSRGVRVGEIVRQPRWSGEPEPVREGRPGHVKALTYINPDAPRLDWHEGDPEKIVLVEDQVSAAKIYQHTGLTAIALLGNTVNEHAVGALLDTRVQSLLIWLDPDMNSDAFKLNETIGNLFQYSKVILSDVDPKDCTSEQIEEYLYD